MLVVALIMTNLSLGFDVPAPRLDFERDIKPILSQRCYECHGPIKQKGGLRLDNSSGISEGGKSGPAIVASKSAESLLFQRITSADMTTRMPPKRDSLSKEQIEALQEWIDQGANMPRADDAGTTNLLGWALHSIKQVAVPTLPEGHRSWIRNPIDAYVLEKLLSNGLHPTREADQRTLLRRLSIDLTGLAPTPDELNSFLNDRSPEAYERQVTRLLASPRYGERWARHWLDVVHYADSHGHDEDVERPNAWPYRDYLIHAFNDDKPYKHFVQEQIAGDIISPEDANALIATGFLAAGPWDQSGLAGVREDSLDRQVAYYLDRDDIVTSTMSTFAGLTVGCARCHDHKFDPITQEDYYSLQAVFAGIDKAERNYDTDPVVAKKRGELQRDLVQVQSWRGKVNSELLSDERQTMAAAYEKQYRQSQGAWLVPAILGVRAKHGSILKPLHDQSILAVGNRPDKDTYTVTLGVDAARVTGFRLEVFSDETLPQRGPGRADNGNFHLSEIRVSARPKGSNEPCSPIKLKSAVADFDQAGWGIAQSIDGDTATGWGIHPAVGQIHQAIFTLEQPLESADGIELNVQLDQLHGAGHLIGRFRLAIIAADVQASDFKNAVAEHIVEILDIPVGWRSSEQRAELARWVWEQKLHAEVSQLPPPNRVYCGTNQAAAGGRTAPLTKPRPVHVLKRGEILTPGPLATPGSVIAVRQLPGRFTLANSNDAGQRRVALAHWLTDSANPLTYRVIVNRVWHYHFGKGIVDTPNDFGKMGGKPSHPELLDWLALQFLNNGGSLKHLHRLIVCSSTYRQAVLHDVSASAKDGDNRLLWRMNRQRLDAETIRDAVLQVSGQLDQTMYGPPAKHFVQKQGVHATAEAHYDQFDVDSPAATRRSIYRFIFRTQPDPLLARLDCPDASQSTPVRLSSVGALQALALWNNKFMLHQADQLAALTEKSRDDLTVQLNFISERLFLRGASEQEIKDWTHYAQAHGLANLCRVLFNSSEFLFVD
jgi:hypothetical protein